MASIIVGIVLIILQLMGDIGNLATGGLGFYDLMSFLGYSFIGIIGVIFLIVGIWEKRHKPSKDSNSDKEHKEAHATEVDIISTEEDSAIEVITSLSEETKMENKRPYIRFCGKCGSQIDSETKKCTGCGKQYFKGLKHYFKLIFNKKRILPIVLSVLLVFSLISNILQQIDINDYTNIVREKHNTIKEKDEEFWEEFKKRLNLQQKLNFYEKNAVIVSDDGTNLYHKYGCEDLDLSYFWIYNTENAKHQGYVPHSKCCG